MIADLQIEFEKRFENEILFDGDDGLFKNLIKDVKIYFEYGCGKSTQFIYCNSNCKIFAVDTSKFWIEKVSNISSLGKPERLNLKWINVGDIEDWGYPISFKMRDNFNLYANWFWKKNECPDLVLIDGRFRVLCFLTTIKHAPIGTKIIFDDYTNRPNYHFVEKYLSRVKECGRQCMFVVPSKDQINFSELDKDIESFRNVMD